jgi:hypothetical protein
MDMLQKEDKYLQLEQRNKISLKNMYYIYN